MKFARSNASRGSTQSAQRTGRTAETAQFLDTMIEVLVNTPCEPMARKYWRRMPADDAFVSDPK